MAEDSFYCGSFPEGFAWGVATASYQIEGGYNDDGKGESIWDVFSHQPGRIKDGSTGDVACDSYHQSARDIELIKELGVSHYRFSISWSRILPQGTPDNINQKGIEYYNKLIDGLRHVGVEPMPTLYHWDLPQALLEQGGWLNKEKIVEWFTDYAKVCFQNFGDRVKYWITINEPFVMAVFGYGTGVNAPGIKDLGVSPYIVGHTALLSHASVYHLYQNEFKPNQKGMIGISISSDWQEPLDPDNSSHVEAAERALQFSIGWFANPIFGAGDYPQVMKDKIGEKSKAEGRETSRLPVFTPEQVQSIKGSADFFGLNQYTTRLTRPKERQSDEKPDPSETIPDADVDEISDPKWDIAASHWLKIVPWGLRKLLVWIKDQYGNPPVYITENGCSDTGETLHDQQRVQFYTNYLSEVLKAIHLHNCDVKGYFAWSLMDNFEWASGYLEKFGLYHVNFTDISRTCAAKDSARTYSKIVRDNGIIKEKK